MALNSPDIKTELLLNDARNSLFLEDTTGLYSPDNLLGYNLPGGLTVSSVTLVKITLNYTQLSTTLVYIFTIDTGVITACTVSFASGVPISIISTIPSTIWPFTSANRFELTTQYNNSYTLPSLDDMVYELSYEVEGTYLAQTYDYLNEIQELMDVATVCCLNKASIKMNINDVTGEEKVLKAYGYLITAHSANEDLNTDKANIYINKAKAICDITGCGCGCN